MSIYSRAYSVALEMDEVGPNIHKIINFTSVNASVPCILVKIPDIRII